MRWRSSVTVVDDARGRTRVGGNPRPAKLVTSTFTFRGAMVCYGTYSVGKIVEAVVVDD